MGNRTRKQLILDTISDLAVSFTYYDRKEDDELVRGSIEEAVETGEITIDEMVQQFKLKLEENL